MTLAQMVSDVKVRIGSEPEVTDDNIKTWLNQGLRAFCSEHDFSWLERRSTSSGVAAQTDYLLPTDCKRMIEVRIDPTSTDPGVYTYTPWKQRFGVTPTDKTFSSIDGVLYIHPAPTATGSGNMYLSYVRYATDMTEDGDSPSDTDIANMPSAYHESLILYAFAIYQSYDEEHDERRDLMGSPTNPIPGTFYYVVNLAKKEDQRRVTGGKVRMLSSQEVAGYSHPNIVPKNRSAILGV